MDREPEIRKDLARSGLPNYPMGGETYTITESMIIKHRETSEPVKFVTRVMRNQRIYGGV